MSAKLKSQIAALQRQLAKSTLNAGNTSVSAASAARAGSKSAKRKARRRAGNSGAAVSYVAPVVRVSNPKVVRNPRGIPADGTIRVKRKEFLASIENGFGYKLIHPSKFAWLKGLATLYDRYVLHSVQVFWKPAVGTNTTGMMMMGIDWDGKSDLTTDEKAKLAVMSAQPCFEVPVWQMGSMSLPKNKLMSRKSYLTETPKEPFEIGDIENYCPGCIMYCCTIPKGTAAGHLWVEIDISFSGPCVSA